MYRVMFIGLLALCVSAPAFGQATARHTAKKAESHEADVVYVDTPHDVVDRMLEVANVKKDSLMYDLGCGDGRLVVRAAQRYGCNAIGVDIDPARIAESKANAKKAGVQSQAKFLQKDVFTLDLSEANVITLYLLPTLNVRLIPQLEKLKPGSRIVSHDFDMEGVKPDKTITMVSQEDGVEHLIYLWITPLTKK